jgi:1-acyl-sn-glycerol-3-phosphate acyltransferase
LGKALITKINYYWRLFATGLSFFVFGLGGLILRIFVFPLLGIASSNRLQKKIWAQKAVQLSFYAFIGLMHRLGIMTYEINGLEKLNRPRQLIIANHPTLVDIVFLISRIPQANCIVKAALFHNIFTKGPIINAGYISNYDPEEMINACVDGLKAGEIMVVFPEGTRTVDGEKYKFQRGAAAIALQAEAIVTPVTLTCIPSTLTKEQKWYQIPQRKFHLSMDVEDDIVLDEFLAIEQKTIAVRRFTHYLQDYFSQQRERYEQCNGK